MSKRRRARVARGVDHFKNVREAIHTTQFYDMAWLQGQVKAACRFSREVEIVLAAMEEDFSGDIKNAVMAALEECEEREAC